MVSEKKRRLPGVESAQSLESFCNSYIAYQGDLKKEAERLEKETEEKLDEWNREKKKAERLPEQLRSAEKKIRKKESERNFLQEELEETEDGRTETADLDLEEEEACRRLCGNCERQLRELEDRRRQQEEMREQSQEFMQILEKNQKAARRAEGYRGRAKDHVAEVCRRFPSCEKEIVQWMGRPVEEVIYDFEDHLPPERAKEDAIVYSPIRILQIPDYLIAPHTFPYQFQKAAELMGIRILIALLLLAGVVSAFLCTPFMVPVSVLLSLLPGIRIRKLNLRYITGQIPWEELNVCRFILNYSMEEAEALARRSCDLPYESSREFEEGYQLRMKQMKQREQELRGQLPGCQEAFEKGRAAYEKLTAELAAAQEKGAKKNSRLGHAIQKQKNHLELTDNETMLLKSYMAELSGLRNKLETQKQRTGQAALVLKQKKEELQQLTAKIRDEGQLFQERHARLTQIETVLSSEDGEQDMNDEKRRLERERDQELQRIHREYEERRTRRMEEAQRRKKEARARLERELDQKEAELEDLQRNFQNLELENSRQEQRLTQLKKDCQAVGQKARQKREEANFLFTPEVWKENSRLWVEASRTLIAEPKPTGEYTVKDCAWIMGPDRPYLLKHDLSPCVLLYDRDDEAGGENRPTYYLEKTVKALMFGLKNSNAPGLLDFALIDESGTGGKAGESVKQCYGSQDLGRLNAFLDRQIEKIRQDDRGDTVSSINEGRAKYFMDNKLVSAEELQKNLYRTLFVFVMPQIRAQEKPMNHSELWRKLQEDCGRFGFVPLFLIPKKDWEAALAGEGYGSAFASAVREGLNMFSHVRKAEIPLN